LIIPEFHRRLIEERHLCRQFSNGKQVGPAALVGWMFAARLLYRPGYDASQLQDSGPCLGLSGLISARQLFDESTEEIDAHWFTFNAECLIGNSGLLAQLQQFMR
jgi:hypothetical protein